MAKIEIDDGLFEKVLRLSRAAGYETPDEFVSHMLERELRPGRDEDMDGEILERLKELGYIS